MAQETLIHLLGLFAWTTLWGAVMCWQSRISMLWAPIAVWVSLYGLFYYGTRDCWLRMTGRSELADKEWSDRFWRGLGGRDLDRPE